MHYGFQSSGSHILDYANIRLEPDERPEDLFQRLVAFVEDSLISKTGAILHHGALPEEDEEMSPTLENLIVLNWLRLIHPDLPRLVKQRYGTELRSKTLASFKPEISQAMTSLLDELRSSKEARVMRNANWGMPKPRNTSSSKPYTSSARPWCPLCRQANRPDFYHYSTSVSAHI